MFEVVESVPERDVSTCRPSDPINTEAPAFARAFERPDTSACLIIGAFGAGAVAAAFLVAGRVAGSPVAGTGTAGALLFHGRRSRCLLDSG